MYSEAVKLFAMLAEDDGDIDILAEGIMKGHGQVAVARTLKPNFKEFHTGRLHMNGRSLTLLIPGPKSQTNLRSHPKVIQLVRPKVQGVSGGNRGLVF